MRKRITAKQRRERRELAQMVGAILVLAPIIFAFAAMAGHHLANH